MKSLKILVILFFVKMSISAFALSSTSADAEKAAESLYVKGSTFADTIAQTAKKTVAWKDAQIAESAKDFKFSKFYASFCFSQYNVGEKATLNPEVNPDWKFDLNASFDGEPLWKEIKVPFGSGIDLEFLNPRFFNRSMFFVTFTIESAKDAKMPLSISTGGVCEFFLNGKKIYAADAYAKQRGYQGRKDVRPRNQQGMTTPLELLSLDLKKGENRVVMSFFMPWAKRNVGLYLSPFADPSDILAAKIAQDFPIVSDAIFYAKGNRQIIPSLLSNVDNRPLLENSFEIAIERSLFSAGKFEKQYESLKKSPSANAERLALFEQIALTRVVECKLAYDVKNVRAALEDTLKTYPDAPAAKHIKTLEEWEKKIPDLKKRILAGDKTAERDAANFKKFCNSALLDNPLFKKYSKWAYIFRPDGTRKMGLPQNWQGNTALLNAGFRKGKAKTHNFKDELWITEDISKQKAKSVFAPKNAIADIDVSYDGKKILYSTIDERINWQLDEYDIASGKVKKVSPRLHHDIDNYDGAYMPDGKIIFCSTATHVGVPCVSGDDWVANLYTMDPNAGDEKAVDDSIRQLTFEQDADWYPTILENGRVLYTRWEYTDNSHYFSRILMHMNPDGTAQSSFYGSTSYWPNSLFYSRPIPGDPNKFVSIVSGHHGIARLGELHLFDVSKGTQEDKGRVHKFPSFGREYKARILDELVRDSFPLIIHPYPLSEKYIVASVVNYGDEYQGVYLIDAFDNLTRIQSASGGWLLEPTPIVERKKPNEIMDKTNPDIDYGYVFLNDIYQGNGLKDVPRGTVKALRVIEYFYTYRDIGSHNVIGHEASWDVKRIHGTVPVEPDGSAMFKVPANRPIAIQPLDAEGKALALMRTWFTVMPGETQSCVGCHEGQGMTPSTAPAMAARKPPSTIKPFVADVRGYSFERDVQPVLDQYCVGCHNPSNKKLPNFSRENQNAWKHFPESYMNLSSYVRRTGPESSQRMLTPLEFHVDSSELIQMLKKGHKGVKLDEQSMAILITWMDLNVPCKGTWKEIYPKVNYDGYERRKFFLAKYANRHDDPNVINYDGGKRAFTPPTAQKKHTSDAPKSATFPFDAKVAEQMSKSVPNENTPIWKKILKPDSKNLPKEIAIELKNGFTMRLRLVPAGEFVMGSNNGFFDEGPATLAKVEKPFYMGQLEVSNAQYAFFDSTHNSGYQDVLYKDHVNQGYPANLPEHSVVRITWNEADTFCKWLSKECGVEVSLPTEKQWEWAARAGSAEDFWFGKLGTDFGNFENFMDFRSKEFAVAGVDPKPIVNPNKYVANMPADTNVDDGSLLAVASGKYAPNPFGLYDMQGNVAEWTADDYTETLGGKVVADRKTVRGGSWRDRAKLSRVSIRRDYRPWQKVYNVGFRIVINDVQKAAKFFKVAEPMPKYVSKNTKPLPLNFKTIKVDKKKLNEYYY